MTPDILIIDQDNKEGLKIKQTRITVTTSRRIAKVLRGEVIDEQRKDWHASQEGIEMCKVANLLDRN